MQASVPDFSVLEFKTLIEEAPTSQNGWTVQHDGDAGKDHKGIFLGIKSCNNKYRCES